MKPILVVMAAGMGSRYGGNKQIDPITPEGDIIMDFSLYDACRAGFERVVFIIKPDFEEIFKAHMERRAGRFLETAYVYQEISDLPEGYSVPKGRTKPWGTAHAVLSARKLLDAPFAVINADDYYGPVAFEKIYRYLLTAADATHHCMVGFRIENTLSENGTVSRGICKEEDGKLVDIEEHFEVGSLKEGDDAGKIAAYDAAGKRHLIEVGTPVSMNLWGFGRAFLDRIAEGFPAALDRILNENPLKGEYYLPLCIDDAIKTGASTFSVLRSEDRWFGVTYQEDKPLVTERIGERKADGTYPQDLWGQD